MASRKPPPQSPLDRASVVTRAIELADREGLESVSIRRLAREHDVTPMALYWHFREKDQLYDAMAERVFSQVRLPAPGAGGGDGGWEAALHDTLAAFLGAIRPHPAMAQLVLNRTFDSAAGLAVAERVLALLADAGFAPDAAADVGTQVMCSLVTLVASEPGPPRNLDPEVRAAEVRTKQAQLGALAPEAYPHVIAAAGALADCGSEDAYFARGIDLLVLGTAGLRR